MKQYLITDPQYYSNDPETLSRILSSAFARHHPEFACYRNKSLENISLQQQLAQSFLQCCRKHSVNAFINQNIELGITLGFDGIHLTSSQFDAIPVVKKSHLQIIASTHTQEEIRICSRAGADFVTYSPIFDTPGKGKPLGIDTLRQTLENCPIPIIALGGIVSQEQLKLLENISVYGFASIRYFVESTL